MHASSSRKVMGISAVTLFHVLMIYAFYVAFLPAFKTIIHETTVVPVVDVSLPKPPLEPYHPHSPTTLPIFVDMPKTPEIDHSDQVIHVVFRTPTQPTHIIDAPRVLPSLEARPDPQHRNVRPEYPATSIRLKEEGISVLSVLIDENGDIVDAKLATSSGSTRLDDAALRGVTSHGMNRWHYLPALKDGKPIPVWQFVSIKWALQPRGY